MKFIKSILLFIALLAPLINFYPLLGKILGISIGSVTLFFFGLNLLIILLNFKLFKIFIKNNFFFKIFFFFIIAPLMVYFLTEDSSLIRVLVNLYYMMK